MQFTTGKELGLRVTFEVLGSRATLCLPGVLACCARLRQVRLRNAPHLTAHDAATVPTMATWGCECHLDAHLRKPGPLGLSLRRCEGTAGQTGRGLTEHIP